MRIFIMYFFVCTVALVVVFTCLYVFLYVLTACKCMYWSVFVYWVYIRTVDIAPYVVSRFVWLMYSIRLGVHCFSYLFQDILLSVVP